MVQVLVPIGVSLLAGFLTKKYSKAKGSDAHKIASPIVAVVAAGATAALTGDLTTIQDISQAGVEYGLLASGAQAVFHSALEKLTGRKVF